MAQAKKLLNKLQRRQRSVKERTADTVDMDKMQETMTDSPGAYKLMRGTARRADAGWGYDTVKHEPMLEYKAVATDMERFDYDPGAGTDYGTRLTMAAGMIAAIGARPGDVVEVRQEGSELEGRMLTIVAVTDATHLRLDDVASFVGPETDVSLRFLISAVKKDYF